MAHSKDKQNALRRFFIEGMALKQASVQVSVSYQTAQNWKRKAQAEGDNWEQARASYRLSAAGVDDVNLVIIEDFTRLYQSTVKHVNDLEPLDRVKAVASLADAYSKFVGATAKSSPKFAKIGVALDVLKMVMLAIKKDKPALFDEFSELLEKIGVNIQDKYEK